jgi:hypothetical protein
MARIYTPQLEQIRKMDADEAWNVAAVQDTESVPLMLMPMTGGYWNP